MKNIIYSLPEISKGKQWYVYFYYKKADLPGYPLKSDKYRYKDTGDKLRSAGFSSLNRIKNKKERAAEAELLQAAYAKLLKEGWNPWSEELTIDEKAFYGVEVKIDEALEFARGIKKLTLEPSSIGSYKPAWDGFPLFLKKEFQYLQYISEVQKRHANAYIDYVIENSRVKAKTSNNYIIALRGLFEVLEARDYVKENPFLKIKLRRPDENPFREYTTAQLRLIKTFLKGDWLWLAMQLVLYCGIRIDELRNLRAWMINLDVGMVLPPGTITKNKKSKPVLIPPFLQEQFVEYLKGANEEDYIFTLAGKPGTQRMGENWIRHRWAKVRKALGLSDQLKAYGLKHTGGIIMARETKDPTFIKDQFRHASLDQSYQYFGRYYELEGKAEMMSNLNSWEKEV